MKKILLSIAALLSLVVLIVGGFVLFLFGFSQMYYAGPSLDVVGIERVNSFAGIFLIPVGPKQIVMIDAGQDASGKDIKDALAKKSLTANDVVAIFVTHAHPDHCAAISQFPRAAVYALQEEVGLATQKEGYKSPIAHVTGSKVPTPFNVTHPLKDGQIVHLGNTAFEVFSIPGHTPGSAAYLVKGVLFVGDAINLSKSQKAKPPIWFFSNDVDQGVASVRKLAERLKPRANEIKFIATSHNGNATGLDAIIGF